MAVKIRILFFSSHLHEYMVSYRRELKSVEFISVLN
jgi:hypothetical protein